MTETIRYARSGDVRIAYRVEGDGPFDLVFVPPVASNVEVDWDRHPLRSKLYQRLATFSRLILFDKRGTGLSDPVSGLPGLDERMDDLRAVIDAVGTDRAAFFGVGEGGPLSLLFASTFPDRIFALVLLASAPRFVRSHDFPWGPSREEYESEIEAFEKDWGTASGVAARDMRELSLAAATDEEQVRAWATASRHGASPGALVKLLRMNMEIDVRSLLPTVRVATLVLHRTHDWIDVGAARHMAERIPEARFVELTEPDLLDDLDPIAEETRSFLQTCWDARAWEIDETNRVLATVLFTDIVGSAEQAVELGDAAWVDLIRLHNSIVRRQLIRFRGRELDTAGDGFFAMFDGPARAIRCAVAIRDELVAAGLRIRAGLHTGECEVVEGKIGGVAVAVGARVAGLATPGEVLVSGTVRDLVAGAGLAFSDRGVAELKGVPGDWRVYAVETG